jgi:hypothetical protein
MSKVEVSKSQGPHEVKHVLNPSNDTSDVFYTSNYTVHGYQVIVLGCNGTTNLTFEIQCTNDDGGVLGDGKASATNWQTIASYDVDNGNNSSGLMYSDVWNFKYARAKVSGTKGGVSSFTVIEKHNP